MFGKVRETPQTEATPFHPRFPYGCAKALSHMLTINYRESYNIFAANAIMYNTESERRGLQFVTRKICQGVAEIAAGERKFIELGNLDASRDWSYAGDIVEGLYRIAHHSEPDDFVLCSGITHTIRDFLAEAFGHINIKDWTPYVKVNPGFIRPAEVDILLGDNTKARTILGWEPRVGFEELVRIMTVSELQKQGIPENYILNNNNIKTEQ